ncbi:MAG: hypothetical protein HY237_05110 [Acidobacteria bacterium]|nr:hypothetical protein [Acidobacteriota bacterium]
MESSATRRLFFLAVAIALAFLPLIEFFDTWEHPWSDNSDEIVFTLTWCALALGFCSLRHLLPLFLKALFLISPRVLWATVFHERGFQETTFAFSFSSAPLRI